MPQLPGGVTAKNAETAEECQTGLTGFSGLSGPSCYPVEIMASFLRCLPPVSDGLQATLHDNLGNDGLRVCLRPVATLMKPRPDSRVRQPF